MLGVLSRNSFWNDPSAKKWVKAGPAIIRYINNHPHQHHLLGFSMREPLVASKCLVLQTVS